MGDSKKTKEALVEEFEALRSRVAELERMEAEREKTEERLKQYQFMVESAHDVIFFKDLESRYIIANSKTLEAFGLSREQVIGKNDYEIMTKKEEARKNIEDDKLVFETGKLTEVTKHMTGADGKERWFQAVKTPQFDEEGNLIGLVGVARDIIEHKRAEEALQESKERFRALTESTSDWVWEVDQSGIYTYASPKVKDLLGYEPEEIIGKTPFDFMLPNEAERVAELFKNIVESRKPFDGLQNTNIHKDGRLVVLETSGVPIFGEGENLLGYRGIDRDITERKKAEEALVHSEEKYRSVVENIGIGVSLISPKMEILAMNRQMREWFPDIDDSKKPICYKSFNRPARDDICSYCPTDKSLKDGQVHEAITETPAGDKIINYRIVSSPVKDKDGKVIAAIEMVEDITERKKTEEALKESEERYRALFQGAAEGIIVADSKTMEFIYANPAICGMLGYTEEGLKQMGVRDIHPKEDLEYVISEFEAQARGEKTLSANIPCLRKDGTTMYTDVNTARVLLNGRECNVGFFTDITERKKTEGQLQKARDELEIRVEQRTADLARLNRELRNEITERKRAEEKLLVYQKQLRSLASELSLSEERLRRRIATNVHDHVGQNLAISKIKIESLRESVSSSELAKGLEEIRDLIAQTIESTRSLTFELSPPVLYELGFEAAMEWLVRQTRQQYGLSTEFKGNGQTQLLDHNVRILLFQAVRELLVNVAKHAQAHNVTVSTRRVGNEIRVSVEDDGVGFDISQTHSHDYETPGFGLFSIRERLGHIGGHLEVESKPGLGTRVTLMAPIEQENQNGREERK